MHFYHQLREVDGYKNGLAAKLRSLLHVEVATEWDAMLPYEKTYFPPRRHYPRRMYSPAVDIAVGPFALDRQYIREYDDLLTHHRTIIGALLAAHQRNAQSFQSDFPGPDFQALQHGNLNARCFLAVEIERGNTAAKYLIGSALNAAALGRVGLVICWSQDRLQNLLRIREYMSQLLALEKNVFSPGNLLLLTCAQMDAVLVHSPA